jgi:1,4-alpha-glucan branching enzyme
MVRVGDSGLWSAVVPARAGDRYQYRVLEASGKVTMRADPMARCADMTLTHLSVVPEEAAYLWGDASWMQRRGGVRRGELPLRIYEVHPGSWRSGVSTWAALAEQLIPHVVELGFTHVELMGVAEHPFAGSWGYQVTGYFAPTARLGTPDDLRRFIDAMHTAGIGVLIDWVPAHFAADEWALGRFDGTALYEYRDDRLGLHPQWGTYVFDFGCPRVRNFLISNALYWLGEFHFDGLRVDAVASMLDLGFGRDDGEWVSNEYGGRDNLDAIDFLTELTTTLDERHHDVLIIAEDSSARPGLTHRVDHGGLGFSHMWNLGWTHDVLEYLALDTAQRPAHHHRFTSVVTALSSERVVVPLSHDEVVTAGLLNQMTGEPPQRFAMLRALLAWQWLTPGAPLVFMGTELAPTSAWDHDTGLDWDLLDEPEHRRVYDLVVALNRLADRIRWWTGDDDPNGFSWLDADDAEHSTQSFIRWGEDDLAALVVIANFSEHSRMAQRVGVPGYGRWRVLLDTATPRSAPHWGETSAGRVVDVDAEAVPWQQQPASLVVEVPAFSVVVLGRPGS